MNKAADMIREIVVPQARDIVVRLPIEMIGKRVEVIAFAVDEATDADIPMTHIASEEVLAKDWITKEEDKAWQDL